uniref:Nuclear pore complex protein Nup85 n=1 Tax=Brugia timori TaxID=42155 RepID=A0A0R3Q3H1_9BILA
LKKGHSTDGWKNESEGDNKDMLSRLLCVVPSQLGWNSQDVCYAIFQHSSDAVSSISR